MWPGSGSPARQPRPLSSHPPEWAAVSDGRASAEGIRAQSDGFQRLDAAAADRLQFPPYSCRRRAQLRRAFGCWPYAWRATAPLKVRGRSWQRQQKMCRRTLPGLCFAADSGKCRPAKVRAFLRACPAVQRQPLLSGPSALRAAAVPFPYGCAPASADPRCCSIRGSSPCADDRPAQRWRQSCSRCAPAPRPAAGSEPSESPERHRVPGQRAAASSRDPERGCGDPGTGSFPAADRPPAAAAAGTGCR